MPFSSFEYAVACELFEKLIAEGWTLVSVYDVGSSESTEVLEDAPVVFVGNSSTQREKASIITRIWVLPLSSDGLGLYDAHVKGCVLMRILSRLMTWQHGHWRMNWVIDCRIIKTLSALL